MSSVRAGKPLNFDKFRSRCNEIAEFVSEVISSPTWNNTFGIFSTIACLECETPIRKRVPNGQNEIEAKCHKCSASYTLVDKGNEQFEWKPHCHKVGCGNTSCEHKIDVWRHELKIGGSWACPSCKGQNTFVLGVRYEDNDSRKESI